MNLRTLLGRRWVAACAVPALVVLSAGCTPDHDSAKASNDPAPKGSPETSRVSHACEGADHQDMSAVFFSKADQPVLDASVGRFTTPAGEPCLNLFIWDTDGWKFESYTVSASTWLFDVSMTGKDEDAYDQWLRIPTTTDCVPVRAEVILSKGDLTERFVRDFKAGACGPSVLRNVNKGQRE